MTAASCMPVQRQALEVRQFFWAGRGSALRRRNITAKYDALGHRAMGFDTRHLSASGTRLVLSIMGRLRNIEGIDRELKLDRTRRWERHVDLGKIVGRHVWVRRR